MMNVECIVKPTKDEILFYYGNTLLRHLGSLPLTVWGAGRVELSSTLLAFTAYQIKETFNRNTRLRWSATCQGHSILLEKSHDHVYPMELRNKALQSLTDTTGKWTLACSMPTVHAPLTVPVLSEMLLTVLMVNGSTSLRCLRHVYGTCPSHCPSTATVWLGTYVYMETRPFKKYSPEFKPMRSTLFRLRIESAITLAVVL